MNFHRGLIHILDTKMECVIKAGNAILEGKIAEAVPSAKTVGASVSTLFVQMQRMSYMDVLSLTPSNYFANLAAAHGQSIVKEMAACLRLQKSP